MATSIDGEQSSPLLFEPDIQDTANRHIRKLEDDLSLQNYFSKADSFKAECPGSQLSTYLSSRMKAILVTIADQEIREKGWKDLPKKLELINWFATRLYVSNWELLYSFGEEGCGSVQFLKELQRFEQAAVPFGEAFEYIKAASDIRKVPLRRADRRPRKSWCPKDVENGFNAWQESNESTANRDGARATPRLLSATSPDSSRRAPANSSTPISGRSIEVGRTAPTDAATDQVSSSPAGFDYGGPQFDELEDLNDLANIALPNDGSGDFAPLSDPVDHFRRRKGPVDRSQEEETGLGHRAARHGLSDTETSDGPSTQSRSPETELELKARQEHAVLARGRPVPAATHLTVLTRTDRPSSGTPSRSPIASVLNNPITTLSTASSRYTVLDSVRDGPATLASHEESTSLEHSLGGQYRTTLGRWLYTMPECLRPIRALFASRPCALKRQGDVDLDRSAPAKKRRRLSHIGSSTLACKPGATSFDLSSVAQASPLNPDPTHNLIVPWVIDPNHEPSSLPPEIALPVDNHQLKRVFLVASEASDPTYSAIIIYNFEELKEGWIFSRPSARADFAAAAEVMRRWISGFIGTAFEDWTIIRIETTFDYGGAVTQLLPALHNRQTDSQLAPLWLQLGAALLGSTDKVPTVSEHIKEINTDYERPDQETDVKARAETLLWPTLRLRTMLRVLDNDIIPLVEAMQHDLSQRRQSISCVHEEVKRIGNIVRRWEAQTEDLLNMESEHKRFDSTKALREHMATGIANADRMMEMLQEWARCQTEALGRAEGLLAANFRLYTQQREAWENEYSLRWPETDEVVKMVNSVWANVRPTM